MEIGTSHWRNGLYSIEVTMRACTLNRRSMGNNVLYGSFRSHDAILFLQKKRNDAGFHYFDPARKFDKSYPALRTRFLWTSLRHNASGSVSMKNGASDATYPFSGAEDTQVTSKARGVSFYAVTLFSAVFLFVMMVVGHPFVLLLDRHRRKFHYFIAKMWATLTIMPFFRVEYKGLEHLPGPDSPAVYVSNHQSFLDIYALLTLGRSFKFISKTSIFFYPIIGWAMMLMGVIPLKRMDSRSQLECLKRCMDLIRGGASVFFFPEGTRSKDGKLGGFKKGAFSVAAKTGVPVVPITLCGTGNIMPVGKEGLVNPGSVKVIVHRPLLGNDAGKLCSEARSIIAGSLDFHS